MSASLPIWRSLLYVPTIVERFVARAATRGADAIVLDLEDSIPPAEKPRARTLLADAARRVGAQGADVLVRVNRPWRMMLADLEAAIGPGVGGLFLPKIDSAEHVRMIAEVVAEIEAERGLPEGHTRFVAMLETPGGVLRAEAIASAHPRVCAVTVGSEDLALVCGMEPEPDALAFSMHRSILAAHAAGVLPLGFIGTVADFADLDAFRTVAARARRLGFAGATVIHPGQVAILNAAFSPAPEAVAQARRMIAAYDEAMAKGLGAATFEGRMIDVPVVRRAQAVLARHEAIAARRGE